MNKLIQQVYALMLVTACFFTNTANACSRFTYTGPENTVIVGRSMDWVEDIHTELWAFPAGIARTGNAGPNSVKWVAKYGSVVASGYNIGATDGINTKGLNANLLYLTSSDYGKSVPNRKDLSILNWVQYVLDNYATVDEAVASLEKNPLTIVTMKLPGGEPGVLHLSISDPSGDNAIFEYINGQLVVHHGKQYKVMTNEPTYDKQLALNEYWQNMKGVFLPGTDTPEDRFIRANYYLSTAPQTSDEQKSVATAFSIIRDVSVPIGASIPGRPNVAATIWRTVADLKHKIYYFEATDRPNIFWVDLSKLNLNVGTPVKKLPLSNNQIYGGEVSKNFIVSKPFVSPELTITK